MRLARRQRDLPNVIPNRDKNLGPYLQASMTSKIYPNQHTSIELDKKCMAYS